MGFVWKRITVCHYWILLAALLLQGSLLNATSSSSTTTSSSTTSSSSPPLPSSCDDEFPVSPTSTTMRSPSSISMRLPGRNFEDDDDESLFRRTPVGVGRGWFTGGLGREFDLFDTRGGQHHAAAAEKEEEGAHDDNNSSNGGGGGDDDDEPTILAPWATKTSTVAGKRASTTPVSNRHFQQQQRMPSPPSRPASSKYYPGSTSLPGRAGLGGGHRFNPTGGGGGRGYASSSGVGHSSSSSGSSNRPTVVQSVHEWWTSNISPTVKNWPRIQCRVEPTTTLKIRKTFRPLKTIVRFGADFNTQLGVWQFKSSWEDAIIGGKITLAGKELQLSKSWQLSVGAVEDLVTRLRFRAAVDLQTWKAYARVGFRTERLSPINIMEGFTLLKQLPLDGNRGNVKLEVKANFALPEPEIEYSTESHRSLVGMGDIEVNIDELNLVLDY